MGSTKTAKAQAAATLAAEAPRACDVADAMARAATESCRQHERLHAVMERGCPDIELNGIASVCEACDRHVTELATAFEAASQANGFPDEQARRAANSLWHASREFVRRHEGSDLAATQLKRHSAQKLTELHTEFELQASALLALRQAVVTYRRTRPDQLA
jgi:hypothetical protein